MVQQRKANDSTRYRLISLLPRLRRFCAVLAGGQPGRDALLRTACEKMLAGGDQQQAGPFDRWAFAQVYTAWLEALRGHDAPIAQGKGDEALFRTAFSGTDGGEAEGEETAEILAKLPPQQRCAALLIYGEGFSYEEAAAILDAPVGTVIERAVRALDALIERTGLMADAPAPAQPSGGGANNVESLFPAKRQAR